MSASLAKLCLALVLLFAAEACFTPCFASREDDGLQHRLHTSWAPVDGAPAPIWAITQSSDGYLWIGASDGLYRFDGVRFEEVRPVNGDFPSRDITALMATPEGKIWIGFNTGHVAILDRGRLTSFAPGLDSADVQEFARDPQGCVWAALDGPTNGGLLRFCGGRWARVGDAWGFPAEHAYSLLVGGDGTLWVSAGSQVLTLAPGARRFRLAASVRQGGRLIADREGRVWLLHRSGGMSQVSAASPARGCPPLDMTTSRIGKVNRALFDRDDALWISSIGQGALRLTRRGCSRPEVERVTAATGLSDDVADPIFQDREGDVWIGTTGGLDRFRLADVVQASGVPKTAGYEMAVGSSGDIFISTGHRLFAIKRNGGAALIARLCCNLSFIAAGTDGALFMGDARGLQTLRRDRVARLGPATPTGHDVSSWARDRSGTNWVTMTGLGVFRLVDGRWRPFSLAPFQSASDWWVVQGSGDELWFHSDVDIVLVSRGTVRSFPGRFDPGLGRISILLPERDDLLIAGDYGLARLKGGQFQRLTLNAYPFLSRISGFARAANGDLWLNGSKGITRIANHDLEVAFDRPGSPLPHRTFDFVDGLRGTAQQDQRTQTAFVGRDGRVWFVTNRGVVWIDPARPVRNLLAPTVIVRSVTADGKTLGGSSDYELTPGVRNLQVDFTATSLMSPERVRFRYRLDGVDPGWVDAGARRQAFYTKLTPGRYQFTVRASNGSGVWNDHGATVTLHIPPTFVQSPAFFTACVACAMLLMWLAYAMRLHAQASAMRDRFEVRLAERERIAREIHDTLLQGFSGLILRFQAIATGFKSEEAVRGRMDDALDLAETLLGEGRSKVMRLRDEQGPRELADLIAAGAEALDLSPGIQFRLTIEGVPRAVHPVVAEELASISREAMANSQRHSKCRTVIANIVFRPSGLTVQVQDDGVGMPEGVRSSGRKGRYGLTGMRERADRIRGEMSILSRLESGTEVIVKVPSAFAYRANSRSGRTPKRRRELFTEDV